MRCEDLKNQRFGNLVVIERVENLNKKTRWKCICDCGNYKNVLSNHLKSGAITNCGCIKSKQISKANTKHGLSNSRIYRIYNHMKDRCYRKNDKRYKDYGGRGIKICKEWIEKENGFMNFYNWAMNNGYDENLTIDRIDVNGNYEPDNCRWSTMIQQCNNTRKNRYYEYNGETHTLAEWGRIYNISCKIIRYRIEKNMPSNKIFETRERRKEICI